MVSAFAAAPILSIRGDLRIPYPEASADFLCVCPFKKNPRFFEFFLACVYIIGVALSQGALSRFFEKRILEKKRSPR